MSKKSNNLSGGPKQNPYLIDKLATVPAWIKVGFLKFWLIGAAFFFTVNGLPEVFDALDRLFVCYLLLVLGIEYVSNTIIIWMDNDKFPTKQYLPHEIRRKSILSLLGTAFYVFVMMFFVNTLLDGWVALGIPTIGDLISESTADPFTFSLFFLLFDLIWVKIRGVIKYANKKE